MTDATLVDTSVLLDIATDSPEWFAWSSRQLDRAGSRGPLLINDVVFAETSVRFATLEGTQAFLDTMEVQFDPIPRAALFLAGKAHLSYRRAGGVRLGVLSDFFIGAHAAVRGWALLTRDPARVRASFPSVRLIFPAGG